MKDDLTYVFFTTHTFTFVPEGAGPEGLYGFVTDSPSIRGHYVPLNETGLVAGNPEIAPTQTYSYLTLNTGHVMSYLNTAGTKGDLLQWIGAPSPMFEVSFDGTSVLIEDALTKAGPTELPEGEGDAPPPPDDDEMASRELSSRDGQPAGGGRMDSPLKATPALRIDDSLPLGIDLFTRGFGIARPQ